MQLKRGDKGPAVVELQENLMALDYPLPRWGSDGDLGDETLEAFAMFLRDHGAEADIEPDVISAEELALLAEVLRGVHDTPVAAEHYFDLRKQSNRKHDHGPRPWSQIRGVCLHQTACKFANRPDRMLNVGAHVVIADANFYHLHDFDRIVWHGNGWNDGTIGFEINGLYPGVLGRPETVWNDPETPYVDQPSILTDAAVETTKAGLRWVHRMLARHGVQMKVVVAHRQSSKSRPNDPGSEIWQRAALPIMQELGLTAGAQGFKLGGYAIPEVWDPRAKGIKY